MAVSVQQRAATERALDILRRTGNPFRNYFARNPDDEVCARYHVPELFAAEREQLLCIVDQYRTAGETHSDVVPVLGSKGAGKTHLLHSIKHGNESAWQLLITPGTYHKDTEFVEYLLFQLIDTLLSGAKQKGSRPLEYVSEELCRQRFYSALESLTAAERLELFPAPGLGRWARRLGLGTAQAQEKSQWVLDQLKVPRGSQSQPFVPVRRLCAEAGIAPDHVCELLSGAIDDGVAHDAIGLMRRHIERGFIRMALLGDEGELASFLTYGFAELAFQVRPLRQDLVLAVFKVLMQCFRALTIPVVVAFDQLEDLLMSQRSEDSRRIAESFFAGIVRTMHQIDGICFLIFAERGLWNRFVPSLDGYIQDRLSNPIHVPGHGTVKALRLEAPSLPLVERIVVARLRPALEELRGADELAPLFPFTPEQVSRIAQTEPTLRDMLQQFRQLFDHAVYGQRSQSPSSGHVGEPRLPDSASNRFGGETAMPAIKSVTVVTVPPDSPKNVESELAAPQATKPLIASQDSGDAQPPAMTASGSRAGSFTNVPHRTLEELWEQEMSEAGRRLEPEGSLTGATRELQAGLGTFLQTCHENGVKAGPWRLHHIVPEMIFGEHPTYGVLTVAQWVCKDSQPWRVGIGLFLGRGPGKPKDLQIKLATLEVEPAVIDYLILLRPEDDLALSGKSKSLWQEAERRGRHARLEAVQFRHLALLHGFPRWLAAVSEAGCAGSEAHQLGDFLQDRCGSLLEQLCMPIHQ